MTSAIDRLRNTNTGSSITSRQDLAFSPSPSQGEGRGEDFTQLHKALNPKDHDGRGGRATQRPASPMHIAHLALPAVALGAITFFTSDVRPWLRMWTFAFAVYFACKAWVLIVARWSGQRFTFKRHLQFVFCWAGMQPEPFATVSDRESRQNETEPPQAKVFEGLWKLLAGLLLFATAGTLQRQFGDSVAVWACISAYCLVLHFGILHFFAAYWQRAGVPVAPIMQWPARSTSLNDFWARRWNRAFRDVCHILIIRPTRRLLGPAGALGLVFIASGLVHELIMSVPAAGGFGGPFAYFTLQVPGCWFERRASMKRLMRRRVWIGRVWTATWVILPLPLLVNAMFVQNVLVPFFTAMGVMQ